MADDKQVDPVVVQLAIINERLNTVNENFKKVEAKFVSQEEFRPIRMIVYGAVCMVLTAVGAALIAVVVRGS